MKMYMKKLATLLLAGTLIFSYAFQPAAIYAEELAGAPQDINLTSNGNDNKATDGLVGTGTVEDPYLVDSAEDLSLVAEKVNGGDAAYAKAVYKQVKDIDLNGSATNQWTPIGAKDKKFNGTFIGTGYKITGLYIDDEELSGAGLFGYISSPAKLEGITVNGARVKGKSYVGALAGSAHTGTVKDCKVTGKINVSGNYQVGGMFGGGYVSIDNSSVVAESGSKVTGIYKETDFEGDCVGGLIGFRGEGHIRTTGCTVSGLTVAGTRKIGGLVGSIFTNNIVEGCKVANTKVICNASKDYGTNFLNSSSMAIGGMLGLYTKNGNGDGTLKNCTVENITLGVENKDLAAADKVTMGYVSGGQRGNTVPASTITVENVTVAGTNSGSNAETKFPGSVAMNGEQKIFPNGTGTEEDPFVISSLDELALLANSVNKAGVTYEGQYIKVADGMTFDLTNELQIGTYSNRFKGTFDGNGATVKGLTTSLFGGIEDATIKNLKLVDVNIKNANEQGALLLGNTKVLGVVQDRCVGTITIDGIEVTGSISGTDYVAGIIGGRASMDDGDVITVKNCVNRATIKGTEKVGGIIGYTNSSKGKWVVENCKNYGDITSDYWAGGITGGTTRATVSSCLNEGKIISSGAGVTSDPNDKAVAGGIVGIANSNTIVEDSINNADVKVDKQGCAGGIIGSSSSGGNTVSKSANTGNITGVISAAGIIGGTSSQGDSIDNCYNKGDIEATGDDKAIAGGIYGYKNSSCPVKACLNEGEVKAENGTTYQIGLSKYWYGGATGDKIEDCYYIAEDKIFASSEDGEGEPVEQEGMGLKELAEKLNKAGGTGNFWQPQNDTVQPDPLIPGVLQDDENRIVLIKDKDGKEVEAYTSLADAANAVKDGQTMVLEKDVELDDTLVIKGDKDVTLDLAGYELTLKADVKRPVLEVGDKTGGKDKTHLTLTDSAEEKGFIKSEADTSAICVRVGASMTTKDVKVIFADKNEAASNIAIQVQGELKVEDGTIVESSEYGIVAVANSKIVVNGGEITAKYAAVGGNGTWNDTEITINGGKLTSTGSVGIYHPQNGKLTLNGGTIKGLSGVQMCAGELVIPEDSTVEVIATSEDGRKDKDAGDGPIADGAAISIVERDYPGGTPSAQIKGGSFVSEKAGHAVLAYKWDAKADGDKDSAWDEAGDFVAISGGTYNTPISLDLLADGFALNEPDADGNYGVHKHVMTKVDEKAPTCTEDGVSQTYYKCEVCEKCFEDELGEIEIEDVEALTIPAAGHKYENGKCTICGEDEPGSDSGNDGKPDGDSGSGDDGKPDGDTGSGDDGKPDGDTGSGNDGKPDGNTGSGSEEKPDGNTGSVATGDTSNVLGYGTVMVLAGLAALALNKKRRAK